MSVQGVIEIQKAFNSHKKRSAKGLLVGLYQGGLFLQRESQKEVPVDTGALRASARTRAHGTGFNVYVTVSYGQNYAIYVHENLEARHKPGKKAKFLEDPLRAKRKRIAEIIAEFAEIGV